MKIALAQTNPIIGDITANSAAITDAISRARDQGARLVIFPELAVIGYPPKDLLLKPALIDRCSAAVEKLAARCDDIAAIIGYPCLTQEHPGRPLANAVALCSQGRIQHRCAKSLLPTYDVFDEQRYFEPDGGPDAHKPVTLAGLKLGITICEDLWNDRELFHHTLYHHDPIDTLAQAGAQIIINCSASPFVVGKHAFRLKLLGHAARRHHMPMVYCNQVGGNDELVFDGNSCVIDAQGSVIAHAKAFATDLIVTDLERASSVTPGTMSDTESMYAALVLGMGDYCRKCGFKSIVVGLSGGIDSAVTAALAVAALGCENVHGVAMPSRYSSPGSIDDAQALADNLNIALHTVPIEQAHQAFDAMLTTHFAGREQDTPDTTEENVQARIRGVILMAFSNKFGSLLVTTGNKSELAVGYCTLYGDMCGGMAVLSDVPKTMVWQLAHWINAHHGQVIPQNSITKPPSAELRPDQTDQDALPPYELLDQIIERYVEKEQSAAQIIDELPDADRDTVLHIVRLIDLNEYKRKQAAPGIKVTGRAFGFGRRMPIAQRYDNTAARPQ